MTERQIRATIAAVLAELDQIARKAARVAGAVVLPGLIGAALAGCDHRPVSIEEASVGDPDAGALRTDARRALDQRRPARELGNVPPYMAPDPDRGTAPPPAGAYSAPPPFDGGPGPMYASPFPAKD